MTIWNKVFDKDFTSMANTAAGTPGSRVIDPLFIDVAGGVLSVVSGKLNVYTVGTLAGSFNGAYGLFDNSLSARNKRLIARVGPGDTLNSAGQTNGFILNYFNDGANQLIDGINVSATTFQHYPILQTIDSITGTTLSAGSAEGVSAPSGGISAKIQSTDNVDIEVISQASFPRYDTIAIHIQGATPPAIGTYLNGSTPTASSTTTVTDTTKTWTTDQWINYYVWVPSTRSYGLITTNSATVLTVPTWVYGSSPAVGVPYTIVAGIYISNTTTVQTLQESNNKILPAGLSGWGNNTYTAKYTRLALFNDVDLSPALPHILANNSSGISWSAYNFNKLTTVTPTYATGGTGNYTYYWHRSTTSGFTPSDATRLSPALSSPSWTDSSITANTTYYYVLETFDGATKLYTFPGDGTQAAMYPVNSYRSVVTDVNYMVNGHSYVTGSNASNPGIAIGTNTNFAPMIGHLLQQDSLGGGARTSILTRNGYSGSSMPQWKPNVGAMFRQAMQRGIMGGAKVAFWLLTTNDVNSGKYTTRAMVRDFWKDIFTNTRSFYDVSKHYILVAPPTNNGFVYANYKYYAAGQKDAADSNQNYVFLTGQDLLPRWQANGSGRYMLSIQPIYYGIATASGTTTTLTDGNNAWTTNQYAGRTVKFTAGTGAGQTAVIASNTATVLTFAAVTTAPDTTTSYEINESIFANIQNNSGKGGNLGFESTVSGADASNGYLGKVSLQGPLLSSDTLHPNDAGHYELALACVSAFLSTENKKATSGSSIFSNVG